MPSHATHMTILDLIIDKLKKEGKEKYDKEILDILEKNKDAAYLGSIAPDIYFFAPDKNQTLYDIYHWILENYDKIPSRLLKFHGNNLKPLTDAMKSVTKEGLKITDDLNDLLCGAITGIKEEGKELFQNTKDTIITAITAVLGELITRIANLFELSTPPIQEGYDETNWYWFDMLHYRNTSDYVINLVKALPDSEHEKTEEYTIPLAYAMGHLSHIAGDLMGHAYVNQMVGGPYRSHSHRHHIQENFMDVWVYKHYKKGELIGAKLHHKFTDGETVDNMSLTNFIDNVQDNSEKLSNLFYLLSQAFKDTYKNTKYPLRISDWFKKEDISTAYWLNLAFLKSNTDCQLSSVEPPSTDELTDAINDLISDLIENLGNPPEPTDAPDLCISFWSDNCDFSWDAFEDLIEYIKEAIEYIGECIEWVLDTITELLNDIACVTGEVIELGACAAIWVLNELITELYQFFRDILVVAGIALPDSDYVGKSPLGLMFTSSCGPWDSFKDYPRRQAVLDLVRDVSLRISHLLYPTTKGEKPVCMNGPYPPKSKPSDFIQDLPTNDKVIEAFSNAKTPEETRLIQQKYLLNGRDNPKYLINNSMGNAVDYAVKIIRQVYEMWKEGKTSVDLPNWNLDADRGYGYKCWNMNYGKAVLPENKDAVVNDYYL